MLIWDLETDGLLHEVTKVHCLHIIDTETDQADRYSDLEFYETLDGSPGEKVPRSGTIEEGLERLLEADQGGHNTVPYDEAVVKKLYGKTFTGRAFDTMLISQLMFGDMRERDYAAYWVKPAVLMSALGRHTLKAWGLRLGNHKDEFDPKNYGHTWATMPFTKEMDDYCAQDVLTNVELYRYLEPLTSGWESAIDLEHRTARIIADQVAYGVRFDEEAAEKLSHDLHVRKVELEEECHKAFEPFYTKDGKVKVPKKDNKRYHYTEGAAFQPVKLNLFNPGSRQHIANRLQAKYGWAPTEFTPTGVPKIDEDILGSLPYAPAKLFAEFMTVQKRIGQVMGGNKAWAKYVHNGRIHGQVRTLGTVTGRMSHDSPNLAQVPASYSPYGHECRSLFRADEGKALVGCDADALELRILAHFLGKYDGGDYVDVVLNGSKEEGTDIHTRNQKAIGLEQRDTAKTWFYGKIYGAGSFKLGTIVMSEWSEEKLSRFYEMYPPGQGRERRIAKLGRDSSEKIMKAIPAYASLNTEVVARAGRGFLRGLDKRRLPAGAPHSALNRICQSAGAVIMKRALVIAVDDWAGAGLEVQPILNIHDEFQVLCDPEHAEQVGKIAAEAIRKAGEYYNLRCPLAGDYDIGENWSQTH